MFPGDPGVKEVGISSASAAPTEPSQGAQSEDADSLFRSLQEHLPEVVVDPAVAGLLAESLFAEGEKRWKPTLQRLRTLIDGIDQ